MMGIEWITTPGLTEYEEAMDFMEGRVEAIQRGLASECVWFLEHPPLYTAGTSAKPEDLTDPDRFPVYEAKRGGQYTYHGPGQRVVYIMLDLNKRGRDVSGFVHKLEAWIIATLEEFNIKGEIREGRVGVWVPRPNSLGVEDKIAAIGIRLRKWITFHGIAINHDPDLSHFSGIVPCGIAEHGVTSMVKLGLPVTMDDLDVALKKNFEPIFSAQPDSEPTE